MKSQEIIVQLQSVLPQITTLFNNSLVITSITSSGLVATVTTENPHNLKNGKAVAISGSSSPVVIASIDRVGTIVTVVTSTNHDITEGFNPTITISGANEAEFNGEFDLKTASNRKTFTFEVTDSGPVSGTGTMILEDPPEPVGFNGLFVVVSVPSSVTFTYALPIALSEVAIGTILLHSSIRVTGAVGIERAVQMYTKQEENDLWAFVVLDDALVSKDRTSKNDGISSAGAGGDRRQQLVQNASVFVFAKVSQELSGRETRDLMVDVRKFLLKALVGVKFDSDLTVNEGLGLTYAGDGIESYSGAVYVHRFDFQLLTSITNDDTADPDLNVAFRDINLTMATNLGTEELTAAIDLDDEAL